MRHQILFLFSLILLFSACSGPESTRQSSQPLAGVRITIDAGHGDTEAYDRFRIGPSGEREEWINLRVAKRLAKKLKRAGAEVYMTRTSNKDVSLGGRATLAKQHKSDLLVSVHHNGSGNDPHMDLPIVYFFGPANKNPASVDFAKILMKSMRDKLSFEQPEAGGVYSDHLIYSSGTSILRNTVGEMPGVIGEGGFFTNARGEARLKDPAYNELEADVYFEAILTYFTRGIPSAIPLVADSLDYINLDQDIAFQLNDGFDSHFFEERDFRILQNGDTLKHRWDPHTGILYGIPHPTDDKRVSFQVFGRTVKGNALHPTPFSFTTKQGFDWYIEQKWYAAFEKGEQALIAIETASDDSTLALIDEALHYYQLSLDLQIVHPKVQQTEEAVLLLLIMKEGMSGIPMDEEIQAQTLRLREFYPQ